MYAVTPAVSGAWQDLFAWAAQTSGVPLVYLDHAAPAPLETLWARDDLGAAFMCGFPFAQATRKPSLLAAPVLAAPRYGGEARYCTDFIVRADGPFSHLPDTFGGRIGWTVRHSQSGYNAIRHHLADLRLLDQGPEPHFAQWVGPLMTPRRVIDAVLQGAIDVGPLDSYVHDLLRRHDPETAAKLRVVASTAMAPIPPLIASAAVAGETAAQLRDVLLSCHRAPEAKEILDMLLITRFAAVTEADYAVLLSWEQQANDQGIKAP
jgi:ABC-type phosphate/phosphonate transport system substrate-binding protein